MDYWQPPMVVHSQLQLTSFDKAAPHVGRKLLFSSTWKTIRRMVPTIVGRVLHSHPRVTCACGRAPCTPMTIAHVRMSCCTSSDRSVYDCNCAACLDAQCFSLTCRLASRFSANGTLDMSFVDTLRKALERIVTDRNEATVSTVHAAIISMVCPSPILHALMRCVASTRMWGLKNCVLGCHSLCWEERILQDEYYDQCRNVHKPFTQSHGDVFCSK